MLYDYSLPLLLGGIWYYLHFIGKETEFVSYLGQTAVKYVESDVTFSDFKFYTIFSVTHCQHLLTDSIR